MVQFNRHSCRQRYVKPITKMWISKFIALMLLSTSCGAEELYRLNVDIDGDERTEVITIDRSDSSKEYRKNFAVKVGESTYKGDHFDMYGELPEFRVVNIKFQETKQRLQLLLMTPEAGWCTYHILGFSEEKIIPLLKYDSASDCEPPEILGNGELITSVWQGFWSLKKRYQLAEDGKSLSPVKATTYKVGVSGVAGKAFVLEEASCLVRTVQKNSLLRINEFDPKKKHYLVESLDGACGWIPDSYVPDLIKDLPWAD